MISLEVKGMSCNHCVKSVTKAVQGVDPAAQVRIALAEGRVDIDSAADAARLQQAIQEAGYEVLAA